LALILPAEAEAEIRQLAATEDLYLTHATRVYSKEGKKPKRVLMAFRFKISNFKSQIVEDSLVLENEHGGRSEAYQELTKDFYL
jgi:tRNA1Val (adenine37-N6)-methyltransferase